MAVTLLFRIGQTVAAGDKVACQLFLLAVCHITNAPLVKSMSCTETILQFEMQRASAYFPQQICGELFRDPGSARQEQDLILLERYGFVIGV
jgi:hypothetical protein